MGEFFVNVPEREFFLFQRKTLVSSKEGLNVFLYSHSSTFEQFLFDLPFAFIYNQRS